jgi:hypothetical protein
MMNVRSHFGRIFRFTSLSTSPAFAFNSPPFSLIELFTQHKEVFTIFIAGGGVLLATYQGLKKDIDESRRELLVKNEGLKKDIEEFRRELLVKNDESRRELLMKIDSIISRDSAALHDRIGWLEGSVSTRSAPPPASSSS